MTTTKKPDTPTVTAKATETAALVEAALGGSTEEAKEFEDEYAFTPADLDYRNFRAQPSAKSQISGSSGNGVQVRVAASCDCGSCR